jgi:outer membrane protein assembly factor BamB
MEGRGAEGPFAEHRVAEKWPEGGPKRVWLFKEAGKGYSGPSIVDGKMFFMGTKGGDCVLFCLDAGSGKEVWTSKIAEVYENAWGDGPRGTPTYDDGLLYAMTGDGTVAASRRRVASKVWSVNMVEDFGGEVPKWGYAESPLVDGDQVIVTPGGDKGAIVALDKKSGKPIWQSKDLTVGAQYVSAILVEHKGVRQYVQLFMKKLAGVAAEDGKLLWETDWPGRTAVIPTPVYHDGLVYVSSGYGVGCMAVDIGDGKSAEEAYKSKAMKNHHGGVILVDDHLYGYSDGAGWVCQEFKTGEMVWNEKDALGKGAVAYADGMLYCVDEGDGTVVLAEASPKGWKETGRFVLDPQTEIRSSKGKIWTHPVIVNGKMYLRDQDHVYCYDVKS